MSPDEEVEADAKNLLDRLIEEGPGLLKDEELVEVVLGPRITAVVRDMDVRAARKLHLRRLDRLSYDEIREAGFIKSDAVKLLAAGEIARRRWPDDEPLPVVRGPETVYELLEDVRKSKREHFVGFYLNSRNQVLQREIISIGSLNASIVHPREVFIPALRWHAATMILAHNHPSGNPEPSEEDLAITRRITEGGKLLGIDLLDHVIVCEQSYTSFKERKLIR